MSNLNDRYFIQDAEITAVIFYYVTDFFERDAIGPGAIVFYSPEKAEIRISSTSRVSMKKKLIFNTIVFFCIVFE